MQKLRESFISNDFIINKNIIKCISKLDISLNEFLLILYFMNISCDLNMENIKKVIGLEDDEIFSAFNSLVSKKYIDMSVSNINGKVIEQIKLDSFYDRLALNNEVKSDDENIYNLYEKELGKTLSSFEYQMINDWLNDGISKDIIVGALKEAILNGVANFKYIDKIVYEWNKNGIKKKGSSNKYKEIEDYDWLSDNE